MVDTRLYRRVLAAPEESFFLLGMRGVGKSTWARQRFPARYGSICSTKACSRRTARPAAVRQRIAPAAARRLGDRRRSATLAVTLERGPPCHRGARVAIRSARLERPQAQGAGTNLLAGRALRREMHPLLPEELAGEFDLMEVLRYGGLPIVWRARSKRDRLEAYVQLYLREEIQGRGVGAQPARVCPLSGRSRRCSTARS